MFAGSPLNRLSWLRTSSVFLNAVVVLPTTRWIVFHSGQPLMVIKRDSPKQQILAFLSTSDIKPFIGSEPFFGQGQNEGEVVVESNEDPHSPVAAARLRGVPIVFLGIHDKTDSLLSDHAFASPEVALQKIDGTPYFAVDIAHLNLSPEEARQTLDATSVAKNGQTLDWSEPRVFLTGLDPFSGAVFAEARSMVDWNYRNKFCPACGSRIYSIWGGWKLSCSSLLPWADNTGRKPCLSGKGLHNFTHPRTDAVVIMIVVDETGDKILLGKSRRTPFYSALAGFMEPGETFEEAVAREVLEESGVKAWDVRYHSGQPWPYPANLMVGFYARADASQPIRIDLDNELIDARWFTRQEMKSVLEHQNGQLGNAEHDKLNEKNDVLNVETRTPKSEAPVIKVPPTTAIAGVLIKDWFEGNIKFPSTLTQKGYL